MRIAFITGCLEPGCDGVGDYTRLLAHESARRGHDVRLLAVGEPVRAADEPGVRRLVRADMVADGGREGRRWLDEFAPDWTSLQFVPYSFAPRGWFAGEVATLVNLMQAAPRRQIYVHETWIGARRGASWLERFSGWRQRVAMRMLWLRVAPALTQTSTEYYRAMLAGIGVHAERLRLFGNVPRVMGNMVEVPGIARGALVCVLFGTLHPNWQPDSFLRDFAALARATGKPAVLLAVGGLGPGRELFARLMEVWRGEVTLIAAGRKSQVELAGIFERCDFGVTSVPWNLVGKSGTAAALREFGLRVVVTNAGEPLRGTIVAGDEAAEDEGFVPYFREHGRLASALERTAPRPGVAEVAEAFLAALEVRR